MTPEQRQEAERLVEALTLPMAGKYIATDDIKKAGFMIKDLLEDKPKANVIDKYNRIVDWLADWFKTLLAGFVIGLVVAQFYAYDSIIKDCKVMGVFRIANHPFSCTEH